MSNYVYGSGISYLQYLQAKSFVGDISSASRKAGREISMEISRQTREIIGSNEALARENIRVSERQHHERLDAIYSATDHIAGAIDAASDRITGALSEGFDRVTYQLQDISAGISELNATFHWGFSQMIAGIGHMNDALSVLIKIAKTPVQNVAFNHFEIARDAFRQGLYQEALEELNKAIQGDHTSSGYKLEWRFHQMVGTIRLGFVDCDLSLVDLAQAEEAFLFAARYAKADYSEDAARAFLSAGWTAYCQGKMKEALAHTEQAIALSPKLTEALFQAAKVHMALGEVDSALPILRQAIDRDRFYILKAAGDGDFKKYNDKLHDFLEALRLEKYQQVAQVVQAAFQKIKFWREHSPEAKNNAELQHIEAFLSEGIKLSLLDLFNIIPTIDSQIDNIRSKANNPFIIQSSHIPGVSYSGQEIYREKQNYQTQEKYTEEESYQEEVMIKPGGLFRKPIAETQTKTRMITKTRPVTKIRMVSNTRMVTRNLKAIKDDIYSGAGELIASIEFCQIPKGQLMMGKKGNQYPVSIKEFYLGKYPVTQIQWYAIMGSNSNYFKGDPNLPVESVSWNDCQVFINKLNLAASKKLYRLPSEEEWEYACRAGSTTAYYFGDDACFLGLYAWYGLNSERKTHPVGQKKANAWGLFDMLGNVGEWTQGWYKDRKWRIIRGGSWSDYSENELHCGYRNFRELDNRFDNLGFRVARSANI